MTHKTDKTDKTDKREQSRFGPSAESKAHRDEEERRAWMFLNAVAERPVAALWDLVTHHGPVIAVEKIRAGQVNQAVRKATEARRDVIDCEVLEARARACGARFYAACDPEWPHQAMFALANLRWSDDLDTPPAQRPLAPFGLWVRGNCEGTHNVFGTAVAIVGSRTATNYGRHVAANVAATCVGADVAVLSGGAFGIDFAAHRAALAAGGRTIAVLACGVDTLYPRGNAELLGEVAKVGAIISEYPPGTQVRRYRFLDRNRLIAALADATVVVEAGMRSGALNTAKYARVCQRPVLAVPGNITQQMSAGTNDLIVAGQADVLVQPNDALLHLPQGDANRVNRPHRRAQPTRAHPTDGLDDAAARVYEALHCRGWRSAEEIIADSGLGPAVVLTQLGLLLTDGLVVRHRGLWQRVPLNSEGQPELPLAN